MNTLTFAGIFIGGGLGSVLRFSLSLLMGKSNFSLPWATLSANVLSCIIMVLVMKLSESLQLSNSLRLMILTGFCGGLSTFSTFSYETATLFKQGDAFWAILNIAISVILCVGILFIAYKKAI